MERETFEIEEVRGVHPVKAWLMTWDWMRLLRLMLGVALIIQGFRDHDWMVGGFGAIFGLMALLNMGCGGGSCGTGGRCNR